MENKVLTRPPKILAREGFRRLRNVVEKGCEVLALNTPRPNTASIMDDLTTRVNQHNGSIPTKFLIGISSSYQLLSLKSSLRSPYFFILSNKLRG